MNEFGIWEGIKNLLHSKVDMPHDIIELQAAYNILRLCVIGYCNTKISKYLHFEVGYIEEIISQYFFFPGWNADLDFSPIAFYNRNKGVRENYMNEVRVISGLCDHNCLEFTYEISKKFSMITERIGDYYDNTD